MDSVDLQFAATGRTIAGFFVPGIPAPGGSKRFVGHAKSTGKAILLDMGGDRNKNWRAIVAQTASLNGPQEPVRGALEVSMTFFMPRPKKHYYGGKRAGELRPDAPIYHTSKPDALKLARSTEDALTGVIWADDAQTAKLSAEKQYSERPGAYVEVKWL